MATKVVSDQWQVSACFIPLDPFVEARDIGQPDPKIAVPGIQFAVLPAGSTTVLDQVGDDTTAGIAAAAVAAAVETANPSQSTLYLLNSSQMFARRLPLNRILYIMECILDLPVAEDLGA